MQKRGQIALWVIVALVIIAAGIAAYLLFPDIFRVGFSKQKAQEIMFEQSENLRDSVAYCAWETVKYYFQKIGYHGGYYEYKFLPYFEHAGEDKVKIVYKGANNLPSLDEILGSQFDHFMEVEGWQKMDECIGIDKFKKFFNIEWEDRDIDLISNLADDNIEIIINWPMKLSKTTLAGKVEQKIEQKHAVLLIPFERIWRVAKDITNQEASGDEFDAYDEDHYMARRTELTHDLRIERIFPDYKTTIFIIRSVPYRIKEEPYYFHFVVDRH